MFVIPPFSLERKRWSQKVQGKPEPLRASCRPRTATVTTAFIIHLLCTKQLVPVLKTAFSKPHAFPSRVTDCKRCIPLCFSYSKILH
jgi:hypothetical protein